MIWDCNNFIRKTRTDFVISMYYIQSG